MNRKSLGYRLSSVVIEDCNLFMNKQHFLFCINLALGLVLFGPATPMGFVRSRQ